MTDLEKARADYYGSHYEDCDIIEDAAKYIKLLEVALKKAEDKLWACPMCGNDRRNREKKCCNPECKGSWGTGCYCCHHQKYLKDAFEKLQRIHRRDFREEDRFDTWPPGRSASPSSNEVVFFQDIEHPDEGEDA